MNFLFRPSSLLIAALALQASAASAQSITWIGTLGGTTSRAHAVSDDGSVLSGFALSTSGRHEAINWSSGAFTGLGSFGNNFNWSLGLSGDGSTAVGFSGGTAFRWSGGVMTAIGTTGGQASGVSHDGSVVSGWLTFNTGNHAFLWDQPNGVRDLGTLGGQASWAKKVSDDGLIAIGRTQNIAGELRAFRWTSSLGMQDLGTLGGNMSDANNISPDGSVIVGWSDGRAFSWTAGGGMIDIGTPSGASAVNAASNNGSILVGWASVNAQEAMLWAGHGPQNMNTLFAALLTPGTRLWEASDISPDGRYIVGYGTNGATHREEGFIIDTVPAPSTLAAFLLGAPS